MTQKITPMRWFDNQAEEVVEFYASVFTDVEVLDRLYYTEAGPEAPGSVLIVTFRIGDLEITALNGGSMYAITPAISFFVHCETDAETGQLWSRLLDGGTALIALDAYPFSEKYGWLADKYGVSWQISLERVKQKVTPFLMFAGSAHGRAEEAMNFYTSLLPDSRIEKIDRYAAGEDGPEGSVRHAIFRLAGQELMAIDSAAPHQFTFSPAVSLFIVCSSRQEVDRLWAALGDRGTPGQCGWIDDRFGVTWQVTPRVLIDMLHDPEKTRRVTEAVYTMSKIEIDKLQAAYDGE